jgi:DNA-directed RNA polymerase specialized sigma24 family protein
MPIDDEVIARARKFDVAAVTAIFAEYYPMVHRISHGLAGRASVGREVERFVLRRAFNVLPTWVDEGAPQRWFSHHAVLASRRTPRGDPNNPDDLLLAAEPAPQLQFVAFIRALRSLPVQQREAFILSFGEKFKNRDIAIAMDCSNQAAATHLTAATSSLGAIAGEKFDEFTQALAKNYQSLEPSEHLLLPSMRSFVARRIWPRRILRAILWTLLLAILAVIAFGVWKLWPMIEI